MTKSKVLKKFHLDPDGYLTTKPDRLLTTEEEATGAAEAAIGEALEEGGAIAEAIWRVRRFEIEETETDVYGVVDATVDDIVGAFLAGEVVELMYMTAGSPMGRQYTVYRLSEVDKYSDGSIVDLIFVTHEMNVGTNSANFLESEIIVNNNSKDITKRDHRFSASGV